MENIDDYQISKKEYNSLKNEYNELRRKINKLLCNPFDDVDKMESVRYSTANDDVMNAVQRLSEDLNDIYTVLSNCKIIDENDISNTVSINDTVTFILTNDSGSHVKRTMTLVGIPLGENGNYDVISVNSPCGQAILGKKIGDATSYTSNKRTFTIVIENIEKGKNIDQEPSKGK